MSKIITERHEKQIAQMIRGWSDEHKLDWVAICVGAQGILGWGTPPTRQALDKKPAIKAAYLAQKGQIKTNKNKLQGMPKPRSTLDAMNKIMRLQAENDLLKAELNKLAEVARRLIYNASLHGLSREKLMAPLPTVHEPKGRG